MSKLDSLLNRVTESAYSATPGPITAGFGPTRPWQPGINERLVNALGTLGTVLALIITVIVLQP
ncbi:MAG: hypothetical protein Q8P50_04755 [Bacillota bacterium]|nr:hypothetical protein [Bacillota bacterium]